VSWVEQVEQSGFGIIGRVFSAEETERLATSLGNSGARRSRAGIRHMMSRPVVSAIANSVELRNIARAVLGDSAIPFRATLFDKSSTSNWLVAWHQDTALPVQTKRDQAGWGPWSIKDGIAYAHAPAHALERVLAIRLHLDDSNTANGPLKVLPETQNCGVLTDDQIHALSEAVDPVECCVGIGGVILMRPLAVHASSKSLSGKPRRVLHIEYTNSLEIDGNLRLAIA